MTATATARTATGAVRALVMAIRARQARGKVALYVPQGSTCIIHDWRRAWGTDRHDYEECCRDGCAARRIMDQRPLDPPSETVDLEWACHAHQVLPDPRRCASVVPAAARLADETNRFPLGCNCGSPGGRRPLEGGWCPVHS